MYKSDHTIISVDTYILLHSLLVVGYSLENREIEITAKTVWRLLEVNKL